VTEELTPLLLEGLNDALLGVSDVWDTSGQQTCRFIYSGDMIAQILIERDGMDFDDAMEFISVNIEQAYVGPTTPIVMWETPDFLQQGEE